VTHRRLKIGLVTNPLAGIGGPAALKGSDGAEIVRLAKQAGSQSKVVERTSLALQELGEVKDKIEIVAFTGPMGGDAALDASLLFTEAGVTSEMTSADDTRRAVEVFQAMGVDIVLFSGGDGTARDVCDVISPGQIVLGIPCGVKMHSGVFANTPKAAGAIIKDIIEGKLTTVTDAEVRDIDEGAFRNGIVKAAYYGEMTVPEELRYIQQTKSGGVEVESLVLHEIAADVVEKMEPGTHYLIGSGTTAAAIMENLNLENTLLGVDVVFDEELLMADANESELSTLARSGSSEIIITVIGGQGHIFGRGNQQLSPRVIRAVGLNHINVIATKSKLEALEGKPLLVDTGDPLLDEELSGLIRVTTGYDDSVLYQVS
jgi:predicted polyphosphate/ATP-dependent NAD kinase